VPDFFDIVGFDTRHLTQRDLGKTRRRADAQSAGDELQQCQALGGIADIHPIRDDAGQFTFRRLGQNGNHFRQTRRHTFPTARPDQGNRLRQITDIVIGPGE
jgi:hypothetical protein